MDFKCGCGAQVFVAGAIQGGLSMNVTPFCLLECLICGEKYLWNNDTSGYEGDSVDARKRLRMRLEEADMVRMSIKPSGLNL